MNIQSIITKKEIDLPFRVPVIENTIMSKPRGGLWTSTYTPNSEYISDWHNFLIGNDWNVPERTDYVYLFEVQSGAKIYTIDTKKDLLELYKQYPYPNKIQSLFTDKKLPDFTKSLDFVKISKKYDAIHLTEDGQIDTRFSDNDEINLYGWNCESTLWFKSKLKLVGKYTIGELLDKRKT